MGTLFSKESFLLGDKLCANLLGECSTWETNDHIMPRWEERSTNACSSYMNTASENVCQL